MSDEEDRDESQDQVHQASADTEPEAERPEEQEYDESVEEHAPDVVHPDPRVHHAMNER